MKYAAIHVHIYHKSILLPRIVYFMIVSEIMVATWAYDSLLCMWVACLLCTPKAQELRAHVV